MTKKMRTQSYSQRSLGHDARAELKSLRTQYDELTKATREWKSSVHELCKSLHQSIVNDHKPTMLALATGLVEITSR